MQGGGAVLVPGEGEPLAGEEFRHHRHYPRRRGVVQDADRILRHGHP
jgi:hypothetical protein